MRKKQKYTSKTQYIFLDVAKEWLEHTKLNVKKSTYMNYTYLLNKHILPFWHNINMRKLSVSDVNAFIADKLLNGKLKQSCGISRKYLQDILSIVKSVANYCEETYGIPNKIRHTKSLHVDKPEIRILNKEEKERLSKSLSKDTTQSKLGVMIALYTGLRIGEVCGLKWEDFNEIDSTITVKRTVQRISDGKGSTELLVGSPKTKASQRTIPLPSFLCEYLKKLKGNSNQPIISETEAYTEPSCLRNIFRKVLAECKIKNLRFHDLRHTFATECVRLNFDTKTLSEILGHKNVTMTLNRYVHSNLELKRKYMNLLVE